MKSNKRKLNVFGLRLSLTTLISAVLLLTIIISFGIVILKNQGRYTSPDYWGRYESLKKIYYNSVYANKKGGFIPDEDIYAFAGGAFIKGVSPILINPEVPPLGKYLIGLSILTFKNENVAVLLSGILALFLMYLIGRQVFVGSFVALIPPTIFSLEPLFKNQFVFTPLLDIFHLTFLLLTLYLFNCARNSRRPILLFALTSISLGFFISTKFFAVGATIVGACLLVLVLNREFKKLMIFIATLPISVFVLLLTYIRVLIIGYPFIKFLGIQKWVLWYNEGHLHTPLSVWPLLFNGHWYIRQQESMSLKSNGC